MDSHDADTLHGVHCTPSHFADALHGLVPVHDPVLRFGSWSCPLKAWSAMPSVVASKAPMVATLAVTEIMSTSAALATPIVTGTWRYKC